MSWTPTQDRMLTEFYAQYVGEVIPLTDIANLLGKNPNTVRARALKLGISERDRPRIAKFRFPEPCPVCGNPFTRQKLRGATTLTCSQSCGQKKRMAEGRHNRGMAGKTHGPEAKAAIGEASRRTWAEMPDEQRARYAERMRTLASGRRPTERTHSRGRGGRRADLNGLYVRSSWEANYARWLDYRLDVIGDIAAWQYEPQTFEFPVKRGTTAYTPDFKVTYADGRHEWHEVKGWLTKQGATALSRFAKHYPQEVLVLVDEPVYRSIAIQASRLLEVWE